MAPSGPGPGRPCDLSPSYLRATRGPGATLLDPPASRANAIRCPSGDHTASAASARSTFTERSLTRRLGVARLTYRVLGPGKEAHDLSEAAAQKALALDDSLGEAHAVLAVRRSMVADHRGAEHHFERAIALEPYRARHREWRARYYLETGRPAEALAEAERALALEPLSSTAAAEVARALIAQDRCDEALARLEPLMALDPRPLRVTPLVVHCYARQGRWAEANALWQPWVEEGDPRARAMTGYLKGRAGQRDDARRIQAQLEMHWRTGRLDPYWLAWVPAALGDRDQAFAWLDRSLEEPARHFPRPLWTARFLDPPFDDLRGDSRLEAFRRRLDPQN